MSSKEFAAQFGRAVWLVRTTRKIAQRSLAKSAGLSVGFVSDVENGKRAVSLYNAHRIARALEIPIQKLLPKEDP